MGGLVEYQFVITGIPGPRSEHAAKSPFYPVAVAGSLHTLTSGRYSTGLGVCLIRCGEKASGTPPRLTYIRFTPADGLMT